MKFNKNKWLVILTIILTVIFSEVSFAKITTLNQTLAQPPIEITNDFKDVPYNPNLPQNKSMIPANPNSQEQRAVNEFAWKAFIALNWPVDCQGKQLYSTDPLSGQKYPKIIGQSPENPRAWELYPTPKDVFLPQGTPPSSLNRLPEVQQCLDDRAGLEVEYQQSLRITETGDLAGRQEFSEVEIASRQDLLDGYGELKEGVSLRDIDAANQIPLVEQQGNYVINETRLNPIEFNQIIENKWYDANQFISLGDSDPKTLFQLVCSEGRKTTTNQKYCDKYEAEGAIEIKAIWRIFDKETTELEKSKYYKTKRKIIDNQGKVLKEQAELGLIGFHIMQKTSSRGWIWSTFEHIDNSPLCGEQKARDYTLYNHECKTENCRKNWPYVTQPYLWHISEQNSKAMTLEGIAVKDQIPSQICRASSIPQSALERNKVWQSSLRAVAKSSVWQYYQLIGTQWLQHPELPYSNTELRRREITPVSPPLTNTSLEPYAQGVSCIVCHTAAHLPGQGSSCKLNGNPKNCADFSFLMDNAQFRKQISSQIK